MCRRPPPQPPPPPHTPLPLNPPHRWAAPRASWTCRRATRRSSSRWEAATAAPRRGLWGPAPAPRGRRRSNERKACALPRPSRVRAFPAHPSPLQPPPPPTPLHPTPNKHPPHPTPHPPTPQPPNPPPPTPQGGNYTDLHKMVGVSSGTEVLYVGDHIYGAGAGGGEGAGGSGGWRGPYSVPTPLVARAPLPAAGAPAGPRPGCAAPALPSPRAGDILRSKKSLGWRTMLVGGACRRLPCGAPRSGVPLSRACAAGVSAAAQVPRPHSSHPHPPPP
jgi:hypothetical protein